VKYFNTSDVKNFNIDMPSDVKIFNPNYTIKNNNYTKNINTLPKGKVLRNLFRLIFR